MKLVSMYCFLLGASYWVTKCLWGWKETLLFWNDTASRVRVSLFFVSSYSNCSVQIMPEANSPSLGNKIASVRIRLRGNVILLCAYFWGKKPEFFAHIVSLRQTVCGRFYLQLQTFIIHASSHFDARAAGLRVLTGRNVKEEDLATNTFNPPDV